MHGTCLMAQPQPAADQDEMVVFSFYSDIIQHPEVGEWGMAVKETIFMGVSNVVHYIGQWKRYRLLWRVQRVSSASLSVPTASMSPLLLAFTF